ncbi:transmembrane protein, putative, partial [Medicago truncatula]
WNKNHEFLIAAIIAFYAKSSYLCLDSSSSSSSSSSSFTHHEVKEDSKIWKCIVIYLIVYVTSSMACYVMGKRLRRPRLRMRLHAT